MTHSLKIGILGGTLEGLISGVLLKDLGYEVHIFEGKKLNTTYMHKGVWIDFSTLDELSELMAVSLKELVSKVTQVQYLNDKGYVINEEKAQYYFCAYQTFFDYFYKQFGVKNYFAAHKINGFIHENNRVIASFTNGKKEAFDLLICTEGYHSFIRSILMPQIPLNYAGYVVWRGSTSKMYLEQDTFQKLQKSLSYQLLSNSHFVSYPVRDSSGETFINYSWYQNVSDGTPLNNLLTTSKGKIRSHSITQSALQEKHWQEALYLAEKKLCPEMAELFKTPQACVVEAIYDLKVEQMVFENIVLMGNSAFHIRPHAGMDVSKAFYEALALTKELREQEHIDVALKNWEHKQLEFGMQILSKSARMGNRIQFQNNWIFNDNNLKLGPGFTDLVEN